ncbi:MAG: hypothetical protein QOK28_1323 [Actinomycetota bacterium]
MWGRLVGGALLCLLGVVWILQGLNIKKGDGMSGHPIWAVLGVVLVVIGAALLRGVRAKRAE